MLFIKELKKICCSFVYLMFIGLLLFSWHKNFYGVTEKEISASIGNDNSVYTEIARSSLLEKPEKNVESYGMKNKEVPEKIMCGGTDMLIVEYLKNSYSTYPFTYYKEAILSDEEKAEILAVISEITGLTEKQINNLPDDYFPFVNGNIIHFSENAGQEENSSFTFEAGENNVTSNTDDYTKHFVSQVSYKRFKELMMKVESIVGKGSHYSMESLLQYYGLSEMTYDEAMEEYNNTVYDDKVSTAFARLFCDYISRFLGLYPIFIAVIFWLKDRRNHMNELIECKQMGTIKFILVRFLAMLMAVMLPIVFLSFESLIPLIGYSADTGIVIDIFAFIKYIIWWLLPMAMVVTSLGMFLTILTCTPLAILIQFVWWFVDTSVTGLSGDTNIYTLVIRHNMLNGYGIIRQDLAVICLNRGILVLLSLILIGISVITYNQKRGGKLEHGYFVQKRWRIFKNRLLSNIQK